MAQACIIGLFLRQIGPKLKDSYALMILLWSNLEMPFNKNIKSMHVVSQVYIWDTTVYDVCLVQYSRWLLWILS